MIIRRLLPLALVATILVLSIDVGPAFAATTVSVDPTFGSAGVAKDASMSWLHETQPAVVADDTYFIGGFQTAATQVIGVDAYDLDGQPVTSYGTAGEAAVDTGIVNFFASGFTATSTNVDDIGVDSNGRVSIAGDASNGATTYLFVVRLTAGGSLDTTFATAGVYAVSTIGSSAAGVPWIDTNPDGTSAVRVDVPAAPWHYFFKLTAAGALDTTFGTAGLASPTCTGDNARPWIDLQPAGDLFTDCFTNGGELQITHLLADGTQDSAFGVGGFTEMPNNGLGVSNLVDRPGGGYYVAGLRGHDDLIALTGAAARPMLVALNANGSLDASFGTAGAVVLPTSKLASALSFSALTLDSSGRLLVLASGTGATSYLLRYLPNGTLDSTFGASAGVQVLPGSPVGWTADFIAAPSPTTVVAYQVLGLRRLILTAAARSTSPPEPAGAAAGAGLARSGASQVQRLLEVGIGLIVVGALLCTVRRRRA